MMMFRTQDDQRLVNGFTAVAATTVVALFAAVGSADVLVWEDFEDGELSRRGWYDVARWGESLSIVGASEVKANTGERCLKIRYAEGSTGGWMHTRFKETPEIHVRYYRLFPAGWEWPRGYGPHDSIVFAGSYGAPTDTDLSVYLDFWKSADTYVRVATARQKWGYGGYGQVLRRCGGVANRLAFNVDRPDEVELGKWHCVEYCARLSDPGKENGCLKLWVNGKLASVLDGLPLVDERHAGILFDHWMLGPYFHGGSNGLKAEYYDGEQLEGRSVTKVASQIAFRRRGWDGRFLCSHVGDNQGDHYSCRWTGFLQPTRSEAYTLTFEANDGGRLWFDGKRIIDSWDQPATISAEVGELVAGRMYPISIEHHKGTFESTRDWKALLYWQSDSVEKQVVPATQFYLPEGFIEPF